MPKVKRAYTPALNIYFSKHETSFLENFAKLAQKYKIPESRLGLLALRKGLKEAVKELDTQETKVRDLVD